MHVDRLINLITVKLWTNTSLSLLLLLLLLLSVII